ncbi:unnamed protein product, partial [marine sediment metagenome]
LENKNQIVVLPTAAGKSLCFQLPSLILTGVTIVVLPLLSLLKDQLLKCKQVELQAGVIKGGQSPEERRNIFQEIRERALRLIFTTPEAISQPRIRDLFRGIEVAHFVVDEAHCISEWGDTFRPAYLQLQEVFKALGAVTLTAFTATATKSVIGKIREGLFAGLEANLVLGNPDRPNIHYTVLPVLTKSRALEGLINSVEPPLLVFSRSRLGTESMAKIQKRRFPDREIFFYHAGLFSEERNKI